MTIEGTRGRFPGGSERNAPTAAGHQSLRRPRKLCALKTSVRGGFSDSLLS
jgi:hypothetical protein